MSVTRDSRVLKAPAFPGRFPPETMPGMCGDVNSNYSDWPVRGQSSCRRDEGRSTVRDRLRKVLVASVEGTLEAHILAVRFE